MLEIEEYSLRKPFSSNPIVLPQPFSNPLKGSHSIAVHRQFEHKQQIDLPNQCGKCEIYEQIVYLCSFLPGATMSVRWGLAGDSRLCSFRSGYFRILLPIHCSPPLPITPQPSTKSIRMFVMILVRISRQSSRRYK